MIDLAALFRITVDPLEIVVRGTVMYWFLFALFRFVLRRDVGSIGIADVLLVVLIADASQNAMAGGYASITDAGTCGELVTVDELRAELSAHGIETFEQVKLAFMEADGEITVIRAGAGAEPGGGPTRQGPPLG